MINIKTLLIAAPVALGLLAAPAAHAEWRGGGHGGGWGHRDAGWGHRGGYGYRGYGVPLGAALLGLGAAAVIASQPPVVYAAPPAYYAQPQYYAQPGYPTQYYAPPDYAQ